VVCGLWFVVCGLWFVVRWGVMLKRHSQLFLTLFIGSDLIINTVSFLLAYLVRFNTDLIPQIAPEPPTLSTYIPLIIILNVIWLLIFRENKLYEPKRGISRVNEFLVVFRSVTIGMVILMGMIFFYRETTFSRVVMILFWGIDIFLLSASRFALRGYLKSLRERGYNQRNMLIVGAGDVGEEVFRKINQYPGLGYKVIGFLDDKKKKADLDGVKILGTLDYFNNIVETEKVDEVIIALPPSAHRRIFSFVHLCNKEGIRVRIVPDIFEIITNRATIDDLDGIPLIGLNQIPLEQIKNRFFKRVEDIVISLLGLIFLLPVFLIVSLIIKLTSKGPVFYKQERVGLDKSPFKIYKFRTMRVDAESDSGPVWAKKDDDRRTKFGSFLRQTSLDELPQLFNVLQGNMSIVGPRPERPHFVKQFKEEIQGYMQRHYVKTGITGWAQVNGWRGNTSIEKRIEYDTYYIQNWSLGLDIKIMILTLWRGFVHENAY